MHADLERARREQIRWRILRTLDAGRPGAVFERLILDVLNSVDLQVTGHELRRELDYLREDADLAARLGFDAQFIAEMPLGAVPAVRFNDQAAFDPGKYLAALLPRIHGEGSHVFEHTAVESIEDGPRRVVTVDGHEIRCDHVIVATNNPLSGSVGAS